MARSKYINTFNTTAEYNNYIESALPAFPNVGYDKEADKVNIRRQSPNDYQIWGTTTATENFNIKLNNKNVEVTVDRYLGEFYLTGWNGTLTSLAYFINGNKEITSIKKIAINTSNVTSMSDGGSGGSFQDCSNLQYINFGGCDLSKVTSFSLCFAGQTMNLQELDLSETNISTSCTDVHYFIYGQRQLKSLNLNNCDFSNVTNQSSMFYGCDSLTDVYINIEGTLMKLTNNLTSQGSNYIPSSATIHYNGTDYKWTGSAWTPQS